MALDSQTIPDGPIWARETVTNRILVLGEASGATSKQVPVTNCALILGEASGHFGVIFWSFSGSFFGPLFGHFLDHFWVPFWG